MQHISTISYKNTHTFERGAIEINERKNIIKISFLLYCNFSLQKKSEERKKIFYEDYNWKCLRAILCKHLNTGIGSLAKSLVDFLNLNMGRIIKCLSLTKNTKSCYFTQTTSFD